MSVSGHGGYNNIRWSCLDTLVITRLIYCADFCRENLMWDCNTRTTRDEHCSVTAEASRKVLGNAKPLCSPPPNTIVRLPMGGGLNTDCGQNIVYFLEITAAWLHMVCGNVGKTHPTECGPGTYWANSWLQYRPSVSFKGPLSCPDTTYSKCQEPGDNLTFRQCYRVTQSDKMDKARCITGGLFIDLQRDCVCSQMIKLSHHCANRLMKY